MDIEKLIEQLNDWNENLISELCADDKLTCDDLCDREDCIVVRVAKALSTLQAENEKLRDELEQVKQCVDGKPAADVAPVRHGRWIVFDSENPESKECTACGYLFSRIHPSNYCPYCGALMREVGNGEK